jgi:hypothetical protein
MRRRVFAALLSLAVLVPGLVLQRLGSASCCAPTRCCCPAPATSRCDGATPCSIRTVEVAAPQMVATLTEVVAASVSLPPADALPLAARAPRDGLARLDPRPPRAS